METVDNGAGRLDLNMQIGSAWVATFAFFETDGSPTDISTQTFSFFLLPYKGSRTKLFNLTNGNGITVPIYSINEIEVRVPAAYITGVQEGQYYWELRRTDLNQPELFGLDYLSYEAVKM